jgi:tetratricopeptide (TPR) repeat protein
MGQARRFFRQAIEAARRHELKNAAAELTAEAGLWEGFFGNNREACRSAQEALAVNRGWRILVRAAITLSLCGRADEAEALAEEMGRQAATATLIQTVSLPIVRGFIELARGSPDRALEVVGPTGARSPRLSLWPAYIAGEAYLRLGSASEARAQFQKILNEGFDVFSPSRPLAKIGIARAFPASGDKDKGRKAYQDFFAYWANADQDIPLFRRALTEYASLK